MRRPVGLLILLSLLTFFAGLGRSAISDSDEAFYAEAAREMVESGDWITPYHNYEYRFQKPILYYWLAALTYQVAGVSAWSARLPSALSGLGLALVAWACASRWYGRRTGLMAGVVVATSFGYFAMARQSLPDLPLAFFVTLATWAGIVAVGDAATRGQARAWLMLAAAAAAAGMLTKGPLGVLLPGLVLIPVMWAERRRRGLLGETRLVDWIAAAALFLAIAAPWYVAMYARHGQPYLEGFFIDDNLERFTAADRFNGPRPPYYYPAILAAGLLPWSPFFLLCAGPLVDRLRRRALGLIERRLLIWTFLPLLFFYLSQGQQPRYALPLVPPLAMLLARAIIVRVSINAAHARDWLLVTCGLIAGFVMLTLALLISRLRPLVDARASASGIAVAMVGIAAVVVFVATLRWPRHLPVVLAASGVVTLGAVQFGVLASGGVEPVERIAEQVTHPESQARRWASFDVFNRNLVFYTRQKQLALPDAQAVVDFLALPERVLLVIPADTLAKIEREYGIKTRRLAAERYFNPTGIKLRTLLGPDPQRDLDHVLLVSNQ